MFCWNLLGCAFFAEADEPTSYYCGCRVGFPWRGNSHLLNNESFLLTVSRLSLDEGSGTLRILSFVPFYESAPPLMKLIGCGIGNMSVAFLNTMPFVSGDGILILESGLLGAAGFFVLMAYMFLLTVVASLRFVY